MDCTEKIILLLGFLFCFILSSNDVATQGKLRFFKLCKDTERYLVENKECSHAYLDGKVKPLLLESIHQGEIWDNTLKRKGTPVLKMFLVPEVGGYDNPFFTYALFHFLASDRFQKGDLQLKQKTLSIPFSAFYRPCWNKRSNLFWYKQHKRH